MRNSLTQVVVVDMNKKDEPIQFVEIENKSDLIICRECGEWTNTKIMQEWQVGGYICEQIDEDLATSCCDYIVDHWDYKRSFDNKPDYD